MIELFIVHCFTARCVYEASRPDILQWRVERHLVEDFRQCHVLGQAAVRAQRNNEMVFFVCQDPQERDR